MKAFLCLGTIDEVAGILPIVQHEFERTGVLPTLLVSRALRDLNFPFCNTSYSEDESKALFLAKQIFESVVAFPSRHDATVEHRHPSHQFDQWDRAGVLHLWRKLPLTLPRRANHALFEIPTILLAADDAERPFPFRDDLHNALVDEFPLHQVIETSEIEAPHPLDWLPIYDAADLIVCAETVHLQLSRATKTPVLALANDQPTPWHGSAPHPRFSWYGHYGSFEVAAERLGELIAR